MTDIIQIDEIIPDRASIGLTSILSLEDKPMILQAMYMHTIGPMLVAIAQCMDKYNLKHSNY